MTKPERLIASIQKDPKLPTLIFFCCIHGNERAGHVALQSFFDHIEKFSDKIQGSIYAIFGNQEAYLREYRFIDKDLNRIWTKSHLQESTRSDNVAEYHEMKDIYNLLYDILNSAKSDVYCIDLHTTSGPTKPFIIMNDALNNRSFVRNLGYPVIFNVESFIEGSLLNLLNDLGHVSMAFEGGEHYSEASVKEIKIFCYKALYHTGMISAEDLIEIGISRKYFKSKAARYFEMIFRQDLKPDDKFEMLGNYLNFQKLKKGERIARLNGNSIFAPEPFQIFMPLYQKKGEDGFFYVKRISSFKLKVARIFRNLNFENVLTILPGVNKPNFYTLDIPRPIVKYIPKRFLFALGYRKSIEVDSHHICFTKQERKLKKLPKLESFISPYHNVT
jgi:succinylglutamate desuccinylase